MSIYTEKEAETKWCPYARGENWNDLRSDVRSFTANRLQSGDPLAQCLCVASRCMAWQWELIIENRDAPLSTSLKLGRSKTHGFCGAFSNG